MRTNETSYDLLSDDDIRRWFANQGVIILESIGGDEATDNTWLHELGILSRRDTLITSEVVTQQFLSQNKSYGGGWYRGGGESFCKIVRLGFDSGNTPASKHIAFKAIHTLGNIKDKMLLEAAWMAVGAGLGICGNEYAVGNGTIVKDFLLPDTEIISEVEKATQEEELKNILDSIGLRPQNGNLQTVQSDNRLMVIDMGSGDIYGPDLIPFILNNS